MPSLQGNMLARVLQSLTAAMVEQPLSAFVASEQAGQPPIAEEQHMSQQSPVEQHMS